MALSLLRRLCSALAAAFHAPVTLESMSFSLRLQVLLLSLFVTSAALATPADSLHHRVKLEGRGPRTVILESGLGDTLEVWTSVQRQIAAGCARTFSYN